MKVLRCKACRNVFSDFEIYKPDQCPLCDRKRLEMVTSKSNFSMKELEQIWLLLRDISITEDERIDEDFLDWEPGTPKSGICHWIEQKCPAVTPNE